MSNKLFVGNLAYSVDDAELQELFAPHGAVSSVTVAKDRDTGRPRGFAFVEMETADQAVAAIQALNGQELSGRQISVAVSQPKPRSSGGNRYR